VGNARGPPSQESARGARRRRFHREKETASFRGWPSSWRGAGGKQGFGRPHWGVVTRRTPKSPPDGPRRAKETPPPDSGAAGDGPPATFTPEESKESASASRTVPRPFPGGPRRPTSRKKLRAGGVARFGRPRLPLTHSAPFHGVAPEQDRENATASRLARDFCFQSVQPRGISAPEKRALKEGFKSGAGVVVPEKPSSDEKQQDFHSRPSGRQPPAEGQLRSSRRAPRLKAGKRNYGFFTARPVQWRFRQKPPHVASTGRGKAPRARERRSSFLSAL